MFRPVWLDDPYGLRTTYAYTDINDDLPDQITDASGRWLRFYGGFASGITRIESSAGQWVNFSSTGSGSTLSTTVSYWDGTSASYQEAAVFGYVWGLVSATDVKAAAAMCSVEYTYTGSYLPAPHSATVAWVEVATEKQPGGPLVSTRTVLERNGTQWAYGQPRMARQVQETRGDGPTRTFTVEPQLGRPVSLTDFRGNATTCEYTYWELFTVSPTKITDALGHATNLTLDWTVDYRRVQITNPDGTYRQFTWFNQAFLATVRDELGRVTSYTRDTQNRITRVDHPDGSHESWTYNSFDQMASHTLKNGAAETFDYDSAGRLLCHHLPTSPDAISYTYYPDGHAWEDRVATVTDPRGNITTYEYNARGQVTKVTHADSTYLSYGYDDFGNKVWEENELRQHTSYTYDVYNRLLTATDPLGRIAQTNYTAPSGAAELTHTSNSPRYVYTPSGGATGHLYDNDWRQTEETRGALTAEAARTRFEYDAVGNLTKQRVEYQSNTWRDTTYAYDIRNRKRFEFAPLGRTTEWQYDLVGNVLTFVNPDATTRTKTYDSLNRPLTETDERGYTTGYAYYPSGKVNTITDARGSVHSHIYDAADRLLARTYPDSSHENWAFDPAGNPANYANRSGQILRYTYDNRNRETYRAWDGGASPAVTIAYDAAARVTSRSNSNGTVGYTYDAAGQVSTNSQSRTGGPSVALSFTYDSDGQRTSFLSGFGTWLGYAYNARHEVAQVQQWGGVPILWTGYTRELTGAPTSQINYGNTVRDDSTYDGAGRLNYHQTFRQSGNVSLFLRRFGYDVRDRRTWSLRDDAYGDTYEYLPDSELYRWRYQVWRPDLNFFNPAGWTDTFAYDAVGNRTSLNENGAVTSYTANNLNQYTAITGQTVSHSDGRGNLTQYNDWAYAYDADNRLVSATKSGYAVSFFYDAEGRLLKVNRNGAVEHRYYDGSQCFFRSQSDGTWIDFTIWGPTPDEAVSRWDAAHGGWAFFHRDPINSPDTATDLGGNVTERYLYDPFGLPDIRDPAWGARTSSTLATPWLLTGQEWMGDLGLCNYKNRFYSSKLGRFLQNDPIRFDGGDLNLYRYCGNGPTNATDPSGLAFVADRPVDRSAAVAAALVKRTPIHREIFFQDGNDPEHIGFHHGSGVAPDAEANRNRYDANSRFPRDPKSLDDALIREAVANVVGAGGWQPEDYCESKTCQEFVLAVIREAKRIEDLRKAKAKKKDPAPEPKPLPDPKPDPKPKPRPDPPAPESNRISRD